MSHFPSFPAVLFRTLLIPLIGLLVSNLGLAKSPKSTVIDRTDWPAFMARHDMVWNTPPKDWRSAPHFGNAMLGTLLFCEANGVRMEINRADVFDHRPGGMAAYYRPRFTLGYFTLRAQGKITGISWRKDLWNAEMTGTVTTDKGEIRLRHFVHADDLAIVTDIQPSEGEAGCTWEWHPGVAKSTRSGGPKLEPNPPGRDEARGDTKVWIQDLLAGGRYAIARAEAKKPGGARTFVVSIAQTYPGNTADAEAAKSVANFLARDKTKAVDAHRQWWHDYYRRSFVSIPDTRLETLYWNSIYRYGSTARKGRFIVDTPGIWAQPCQWCYITTDWNIQAAHWALPTANRVETGGELMELLHRGRDTLAKNVLPVEWQEDSAYIDCSISPDLACSMRQPNLIGDLPWLLHNCWMEYRHTMDDAMLREKLFPLLRRAVNLYLHHLSEKDGRLHMAKTYSPETATTTDCNFDLALLRWGCETLLQSCDRLKIEDPLIPKWKDVLARLTDYPTDEKGYRIGAEASAKPDRHGSQLLMIYPLGLVNIEDHPDKVDLMRRSVQTFASFRQYIAMVASHSVPLAARLGDGEFALKELRRQSADLYPNGMWLTPPCLEASLSSANGIQEMLLQSWGGKIRVFPAMPATWPDAVFNDLRTEGAFLVSARRTGGKTAWVRVKSLAGEPCIVRTGLAGTPRIIAGKKNAVLTPLDGGFLRIALAKGEEVVLSDTAAPPVVEALPSQPEFERSFGLPKVPDKK